MNGKKTDAVIKIENAFIECLKEGRYPDLSVKELIEKAGVGKSTFYRNFHDVYDVFEKMLDEFIGRAMAILYEWLKNKVLFEERFFRNMPADFDDLPLAESDRLLIMYSLQSFDNAVTKKLVETMIERLEKYYGNNAQSLAKAEVCICIIVGSLITGLLQDFLAERSFDKKILNYADELLSLFFGTEE